MDFINVKSLEQATSSLQSLAALKDRSKWTISLAEGSSRALKAIRSSTNPDEVETALNILIQQMLVLIQKDSAETTLDSDPWYTCVECYVTDHLHDAVFGALCAHLERHDSLLRSRCDTAVYAAVVPLAAAVVELSNLDAHTNALEKLACLCTAHDLVYAEVKAAMIELQTEGDSGVGMVVVERDEVVALLAAVIARSKPPHIYTNLYYVQAFGARLFDSPITRQIFDDFSAAVERLAANTTSVDHRRHLELADILQLAASNACADPDTPNTLLGNERRRLLELIITATTQHL